MHCQYINMYDGNTLKLECIKCRRLSQKHANLNINRANLISYKVISRTRSIFYAAVTFLV